jgi:uncharacterized membrane protein YbhN (UPF0104 family)
MYLMLKNIISKRHIALAIVVTTLIAIVVYLSKKPELLTQLKNIPPLLVITIFFLYVSFIVVLAVINDATVKLCKKSINPRENILVTMYSSFINFFGPLQSGPAFRALYFKKLHNIDIKKFTAATMIYYICYAIISGVFLLLNLFRLVFVTNNYT